MKSPMDQARLAKKRQMSGSPSGKLWDESDSITSSEGTSGISEEDVQLSFFKKKSNKGNDKDKRSKMSKRAWKRYKSLDWCMYQEIQS